MHTKLCLEITTGYRCVSIPLLSLPLCPFYWDIKHPITIDNLTVQNYLRPTLHVYYPNFIIKNTNTSQTITTCTDIQVVTNAHLRDALSQKTVVAKKIVEKNFLKDRYKDVELYGKNAFLEAFIKTYYKLIMTKCKEMGLNVRCVKD